MSEKIPLQIPAYLNKYTSITSGGLKIEFITQENINPELLSAIISLKDKLGYLFFGVTQIEAVDLLHLPKIDKTKYADAKTPAQRLRAALFVLHSQQSDRSIDFEKFYDQKMESIISWVKDKIN